MTKCCSPLVKLQGTSLKPWFLIHLQPHVLFSVDLESVWRLAQLPGVCPMGSFSHCGARSLDFVCLQKFSFGQVSTWCSISEPAHDESIAKLHWSVAKATQRPLAQFRFAECPFRAPVPGYCGHQAVSDLRAATPLWCRRLKHARWHSELTLRPGLWSGLLSLRPVALT